MLKGLAYTPYGGTTESVATDNPFRFTGREYEAEDLYYYRARYYDPTGARFLSEDPIGLSGGTNTYIYVQGNPINYIDPFGLAHYLITVGDPGLSHHNVGSNFDRAASTMAENLRAEGHTVEVIRVSSITDFNNALKNTEKIDGDVIYFGHGWIGTLYIGEQSLEGTNLTTSNIGSISGGNLSSNSEVILFSCNSGVGGSESIAQQLSNQFGVPVTGFSQPLGFTGTPGKYLYGEHARPPDTGPIYMTPVPPGKAITFSPIE